VRGDGRLWCGRGRCAARGERTQTGNAVGIALTISSSTGAWRTRGTAPGRPPRRSTTMRVAFYARVSTERQQQAQTIEQQVAALHAYAVAQEGWVVEDERIFRDDGYSGAKLQRPALDALRDQAARAAFDRVLVTT